MTENSDEIKDKVRELKNKLAEAKIKGPSAVEKVMSDIDRSGLPSLELDALMKEAKVAMASAIEVEKKLILGARAGEAKIGTKETGLSEWDQHVKDTYSKFNDASDALEQQHKKRIGLVDEILKESASGNTISNQSIKNLHEHLSNHNVEEELENRRKLAEARRIATFELEWRSLEQKKIETEAAKEGIKLHDNEQKNLSADLVRKKEQFKREWDQHTTPIEEANIVLKKANARYVEIDKWTTGLEKVAKCYEAQGVSKEFLDTLKAHQNKFDPVQSPSNDRNLTSNKISNSRSDERQTLPSKEEPKKVEKSIISDSGKVMSAADLKVLKEVGGKLSSANTHQDLDAKVSSPPSTPQTTINRAGHRRL